MHVYSEINPTVINKVYSVILLYRFSFVCPLKKVHLYLKSLSLISLAGGNILFLNKTILFFLP